MVLLVEIIIEEIGSLRKNMHDRSDQLNSLCDPAVVKASTKLDEKLNRFQRLVQLSSAKGVDQLYLLAKLSPEGRRAQHGGARRKEEDNDSVG
ncbi:aspartyl-phosphate phosphatase Spo0E family protein [Paenibacillus chartarius]|uniref:Aspartyl-phosphate phosphatase Spo0E family protein n=1 Tax=Paenibacillus chartarius TaxID=747481 RepID=A0ABV6DEF4_9BACL